MKVFVAGATGVLGRRAVPLLVAAGHDVSALARSDARASLLGDLGARPVRADLFDPESMRRAVAGHEAVCNLATHIPAPVRMARPGAWAENDRIRTEGSRHLVDGALAGGAPRYVQESIAFLYRDGADEWIDESSPVDPGRLPALGHGGGVERGPGHRRGCLGRGPALRRLLRARQ